MEEDVIFVLVYGEDVNMKFIVDVNYCIEE